MTWWSFFVLSCRVRVFNWKEFVIAVWRYYMHHIRFFVADMAIMGRYFFQSPYRLLRLQDERCSTSLGPYGETPFTTIEKIFTDFHIPIDAAVLEVGSGRGRVALWLALVRGQRYVRACEPCVPFIRHAKRVSRWLRCFDIEWVTSSWQECSFDGIDVVYVYSSAFSDEEATRFAQRMASLPSGVQIITISFWLDSYCPGSFLRKQESDVTFAFGTTKAYVQVVP